MTLKCKVVSNASNSTTEALDRAHCVGMDMHFDGTANASFFTVTLRISPEQIDIGGLFHDNKWPDESPIHEMADEESINESGLTDPAAYTTGDEKPKKKKPKTGLQQPTIMLPPPKGPLPELKLPPRPTPPPGGWASALMKRLAEWVATVSGATLAGIGVFIIAMLSPLDAGVANEWERKLPEEDENRYRELEAKRSAVLAKGEKLPPQEEAEWQALEDRKFPVGRNGNGNKTDSNKNSQSRFPKLDKHHGKHMNEWNPPLSKQEYLEKAITLADAPVGGSILGFTSKEGYTFRYDEGTGEFLTMKPDGTIETMFKPERGKEYYLDQLAKYGK